MKFKVKDKVTFKGGTDFKGCGTITEIDTNAPKLDSLDYDPDYGEYYVVFEGWISGDWFWESELDLVANAGTSTT